MKHFTKCLKFLFLALFFVGGISAWATDVIFTPGTDTGATSVTKSPITVTMSKMDNASYYQIYASASGTFSCTSGEITKIEFTCTASGTSKYGPGNVSANVGSYSYSGNKGTWTGNAASVTLSSTAQVRMSSLTITYAPTVVYTITAQTNNETYGTVILSGSTITATPKAGYRVSTTTPYEVTGTATVTNNGDNTFSVSPSTNCTVQINFEEIPKYTVTLGDNSSTLTEESAGAGVTLPSRSAIGDYTFAGWSDSNVTEETTTAPTIIPAGEYAPTSNVTLYPVYTRTEGGGESETDVSSSMSDIATSNSWSTSSGNNVTCYTSFALDSNITISTTGDANCGSFWGSDWRLYQNKDGNVIVTAKEGCTLNKVTFTFSVSNTGALYYDETAVTSETAVNVSGTSEEFTVGNSGSATNGQVRITDISVTYSAASNTTYYLSAPVATAISTPTFTLAAGTYTGTQSVEIECATDGVTIYYTTNGDEPTTSSVVYSEAIEVSANTTIKAIAVKDEEQSNVGSATYNIKVAAPTFSVEAGTYSATQTVSLASATAGATIYYTTDGSTPTTSSDEYDSAIEVSSTTTIKSIAVKAGLTNSDVSTATYTLKVAAPTFSVAAGKYSEGQTVTLSTTTEGATIYYTTNGTNPTSSSTAYSSALSVATTTTVKAIAIKDGWENSAISEAEYRIVLDNSPGTGYFEKVTDASSLAAGDNILLVNEDAGVTLGTKSNGNNRPEVAVTISSGVIDNPSNVQRLILHGSSSAWNFYADPDGYLYSVKGNNHLKTQANAVAASNATISITNGDATILFTPSNENRYLRYNSGSNLFSCYTSTSTVTGTVQIYKEMPMLPVTVSEAGYATYVNNTFDLNFSESDIKAYKVKVASKAVATLTQVDNVPAGTPVLLYKEGGATEAIPTMTGAAAVTENDLVAGTGAAVATTDGDYTNMILNDVGGNIGFYYANGQTVAANRAYLHIATTLAPEAAAGARMRFVFADDASGIKEIATDKQNDGAIYNLSGQRVNAGYKGIVIKNGKKYLNK